jgi:tetratricopeptide (TPR) repeat protein
MIRALADYATALGMDPSLDAVRLARGRLLLEARRPSEALPDLDHFLTAHADHSEALVVRARARASTGDAPGARDDYDRALRLAPNPDWFIERARLVRESAGPNAAIEGLDEGLARLGPIVTLTLEAIECELALGRHDAALAHLDRLISVSGPHPQWTVQRGDILAAAGRPGDARQAFSAALSAIDALPPSRQRTRQIQALRARCTAALSALDTPARTS